jgi:hypothetical protein
MTPDQELDAIRRTLCATPTESTPDAARRVVHQKLVLKVNVRRLLTKLDLALCALDVQGLELRGIAEDLRRVLKP